MKQKGVMPDMAGVKGVLCDEAPPDVLFGARKIRTSPYDPLLLQLQSAGAGKFLKFESLKARNSVSVRAKKLNIKINFGEQGDFLWVTLQKADLHSNGVVEKQDRPAAKPRRDLVLAAIEAKKDTPGAICTWIRSNGDPAITITFIDGLLGILLRERKIKLKKAIAGDETERWTLAV